MPRRSPSSGFQPITSKSLTDERWEQPVFGTTMNHGAKRQRMEPPTLSTYSDSESFGDVSTSSHEHRSQAQRVDLSDLRNTRNRVPEREFERPSGQKLDGSWESQGSSQLNSLPQPPHLEEGHKREVRKAQIVRRSAELDPPLSLRELELMSSFRAAIQISKPLDEHDWNFLLPRLLDELPAVQDIIHENEEVVRSIKQDQNQTRNDQLTAKAARDAEAVAWNGSQKSVRELLERIAKEYIDNNWAGGADVNHQNCATFAARTLIHSRREYFSQRAASDRSRLVLDAMRWLYDAVIKPIAERYGKNLFACSRCDAPFKPFDGCIQHFAAKHTNTLSSGSAVVAWREVDWPDLAPFNAVPSKRRRSTQTPQQHAGPFPLPPHSATPLSSPSPWPASMYSPPAAAFTSPVLSTGQPPAYYSFYPPSSTPGQDYPSYVPSASGSPIGSHFWPATAMTPTPGYSPRPYGYVYPPPPSQAARPHLTQSPVVMNHLGIPPPPPPLVVSNQQGPEKLGQMMSETWNLLSPLQNIDTSVLVFSVIHNTIAEFQARHSAIPTLDMIKGAVDHDPQLIRLRDADRIDCNACKKRVNASISASTTQESVAWVQLYKFNALLKHFKKAHEGKSSTKYSEAASGPSPLLFDWKKDMISLPENSQIARLSNSPNINPARLAVLDRVFPNIFNTNPSLRHRGPSSDEYDPRNPEIIGPIRPASWQSGRASDQVSTSTRIDQPPSQESPNPLGNVVLDDIRRRGEYPQANANRPRNFGSQSANASDNHLMEHNEQRHEDCVRAADQFLLELEADHLQRQVNMEGGEKRRSRSSTRSEESFQAEDPTDHSNGSSDYNQRRRGSSSTLQHTSHVISTSSPISHRQQDQVRREADESYPRPWPERSYASLRQDALKRERPNEDAEYDEVDTRGMREDDDYSHRKHRKSFY